MSTVAEPKTFNLNLRVLLERLTLRDKNKGTPRRFNFADPFPWAQLELVREVERQYNQGDPVRVLVLKSRQLGISTVSAGILYNWAFLHQGTNGLCLAHETSVAEDIFQKTKLFYDAWPFKSIYPLKYATKHLMRWEDTQSSLRIASAKNLTAGRGFTLHGLHASECAFYPDPQELMTGFFNTIPRAHGSIIIMESTANGEGNWWHDQWLAAEEGDSAFTPMFFPWYRHPEYRAPTSLCTELELSPHEKEMHGLGASYEAIQWYRLTLRDHNNDESYMRQEYCSTPSEAFQATGSPLFPREFLKHAFQREDGAVGRLIDVGGVPRFVRDENGPLTVFRKPVPGATGAYMVGADPSETVEGDGACMQIINTRSFEQVAVWHGQVDPINFAEEMILVGRFYNMAMLCPEIEGGGYASIGVLIKAGYPNIWQHKWSDKAPGKASLSYGWATNYDRKRMALGWIQNLLAEGLLKLHDIKTYHQLQIYAVLPNGQLGNPKAQGDDAVMALAIALGAYALEPSIAQPYTPRTLDIYATDYEAV